MADDPFPRHRISALVRRMPAYLRLSWRLAKDPLLSKARRAAVVGAAGYLASPIDLVPGVIPLLGQLDDIAVAIAALRLALAGLSYGAAPGRISSGRRAHATRISRTTCARSGRRPPGSAGPRTGRRSGSRSRAAERRPRALASRSGRRDRRRVRRPQREGGRQPGSNCRTRGEGVADKAAPAARAMADRATPAAKAVADKAAPAAKATGRAATATRSRGEGRGRQGARRGRRRPREGAPTWADRRSPRCS